MTDRRGELPCDGNSRASRPWDEAPLAPLPATPLLGDRRIGPWLDALIQRYQAGIAARHRRSRRREIVILGLMAAGVAAGSLLFRWDRAAYPSEPAKREALELCGQADPTFVRFFANEREACYDRLLGLVAQPVSAQRLAPSPIVGPSSAVPAAAGHQPSRVPARLAGRRVRVKSGAPPCSISSIGCPSSRVPGPSR
jgi:hypothetical protein